MRSINLLRILQENCVKEGLKLHIRILGLKLHSGQSMEMVKAGQLHFLQSMMHFLDTGRTMTSQHMHVDITGLQAVQWRQRLRLPV